MPRAPTFLPPSLHLHRCDAASNARCRGGLHCQADPCTARERRGQAARCGRHTEGLHDAEAQVGGGRGSWGGGGKLIRSAGRSAILSCTSHQSPPPQWVESPSAPFHGHPPPPLSRRRGGDESFTVLSPPTHTLCCLHLVTAPWSSRSFCERSLTSWSSRWPHTTSGWLQQRNAAAVVKKQPEAGRRKQQQSPWRHCLWGQNRPLIERLLLLLLRRRRRRSNSGCWPSRGPGAGN